MKFFSSLFLLLPPLLLSSPMLRGEETLLKETFAQYETGTSPAQSPDPDSFRWIFHSGLQTSITEDNLPPGAAGNSKVLHIQNNNLQVQPSFHRVFESTEARRISFRFKIRINRFEASKYFLYLTSTDDPRFGPLLVFEPNGSLTIGYGKEKAGGELTRASNPQGPALRAEAWYEIAINADLESQTFSVSITNLNTSAETGSLQDLPFPAPLTSLNQIMVRPMNDPLRQSSLLDWELSELEITALR